mgnify:CR=1 FL=1
MLKIENKMVKKLLLISFLLLFLVTGRSFSSSLFKSLPYPLSTRMIGERSLNIGGENFKTTLYETDVSPQEVIRFYKDKLPIYGWKFCEKCGENFKSMGITSRILIFTRNKELLVIGILPSDSNSTRFFIDRGKVPSF